MTQQADPKQHRRYGIERRDFIQYLAAISAIPSVAAMADEITGKSHDFKDYPFTLGVASGDPEPDGVVIWTRLAPSPLSGDGLPNVPIMTTWEIATDESSRASVDRAVRACECQPISHQRASLS